MRIKTYLVTFVFLPSLLAMPILGLQNSQNIPSRGTVAYPEHQLGMWDVGSGAPIPSKASWIVASSPDYGSINLLENPNFERELPPWKLTTPSNMTPLSVDILDGWKGKSAVMVSDEMGYQGGLRQSLGGEWWNVSSRTTFHFKAMLKTVDVEGLELVALYRDIWDAEGNWYGGSLGAIRGSGDWALYEVSFTTPNITTRVSFYPALVYNKGQVWIDEVYVAADNPTMYPPMNTSVILNWVDLHRPWLNSSPNIFKSQYELKKVEEWLKIVPTQNFWGIIFICEEHYRIHIAFSDDVNTTWFDERLLGYPLYLQQNPNATIDQWKDEMFLRMIRGFHNYFHEKTNVGITAGGNTILAQYVAKFYGKPALDFITKYYDFVILYKYTGNLEDFNRVVKKYFSVIDQLFLKQKKFWILTRIWSYNKETWEREAIALEMKNCLDRNMVITTYLLKPNSQFEEVWSLMLTSLQLYDSEAPYFETYVYGNNLLTGYVGNTYGWVEVLK